VRLDDVVLRALEKDPERRYQHASQVKTAVDTIAGSAPPPPVADKAAVAAAILARDYNLNIRSCVRRGWKLLKGEFWPFVGVTALLIALLGFASSIGGSSIQRGGHSSVEITSALALLVWGPLVGGLLFYFLKKIRQEPATVETAFCGFSHRFLHLFLASFVTSLLTWLGFLCLVLPGIYLMVAWIFVLPLVIDKQLDFWSAMELSRKVVTKHWFKFLGFGIVLLLLTFCGVLMFVVGVFVMSPLVLAALMYAYEDIFGGVTPALTAPPLAAGPAGTMVMPVPPPKPLRAEGGKWSPATKIGLAAVAMVTLVFAGLLCLISMSHRAHRRTPFDILIPYRGGGQSTEQNQSFASAPETQALPEEPPVEIPQSAFGPVMERTMAFDKKGLTDSLSLDSGNIISPLPAGTTVTSTSFTLPTFPGMAPGGISFSRDERMLLATGDTDVKAVARESWNAMLPEQAQAELKQVQFTAGESIFISDTIQEAELPKTFVFKTRQGSIGLLQITGFSDNPSGVKIRYKLAPAPATDAAAVTYVKASRAARDELNERLEAASNITDAGEKDTPLAALATDAAKLGEADIVRNSLSQMIDLTRRDQATHEAVILLAKRGLKKPAIDLAKGIGELNLRDRTLVELAQQRSSGNTP
jgi:hypothetical protein